MSEDSPAWQSDNFGILPHPTDGRILLLDERDGWALPHARLDRSIWLDKLGIVTEAMSRTLGCAVRAYRYADYQRDGDNYLEEGVYLLEWADEMVAPPRIGRWVERTALARLAFQRPEHRAILEDYFAEVAAGVVPERRVPWARAGWFDEVAAWIAVQLAERGDRLVAPVEQVRNWSLSCVLRATATSGTSYFKVACDTALFVNEPAVVTELAKIYPAQIPALIASDTARRWMLARDFGEPIGWSAPPTARETLLLAFGRMQCAAADRPDLLLAAGCRDRRLERLAAQIDPLFADPDVLIGLDTAEIARLRTLAPRLKAFCAELAGYGVPHTIVHGDLHGGNVAIHDGTPVYFDWTDACLSHPFFDLLLILPEDEAAAMHLRDTYLALWSDYATTERLLAAWALARPLTALHQAVSYQAIMAAQEPRTRREHEGDAGKWLRRVLHLLPEGGARLLPTESQ